MNPTRTVFADTFYWVALINSGDSTHDEAVTFDQSFAGKIEVVTTEEVLVEVLNYFSSYRPEAKDSAVKTVIALLGREDIRIVSQSRDSFRNGLNLYKARLDKGYSLTDCISMNTMRAEWITDILTNDVHFIQEGFRALFRA